MKNKRRNCVSKNVSLVIIQVKIKDLYILYQKLLDKYKKLEKITEEEDQTNLLEIIQTETDNFYHKKINKF